MILRCKDSSSAPGGFWKKFPKNSTAKAEILAAFFWGYIEKRGISESAKKIPWVSQATGPKRTESSPGPNISSRNVGFSKGRIHGSVEKSPRPTSFRYNGGYVVHGRKDISLKNGAAVAIAETLSQLGIKF